MFVAGKVLRFAIGIFVRKKMMERPVEEAQEEGSSRRDLEERANEVAELAQDVFEFFLSIGKFFIQNKHGHCQEYQSDRIGMKYMAKAEYDPRGAIWLQQMFVDEFGEGHNLIALFNTHPPSKKRVEECQRVYQLIQDGKVEDIVS